MNTQTILKPLSMGFALVLMAAGCATPSADVQGNTTAESGNPNSVLNKDDPGPKPTDSATYQDQLKLAERSNPNNVGNKDRAPVPPADPVAADQQLRASEAGAPDSVDDRLPKPTAILQRLHAFDRGAIAAGRLGARSGGTSVAAYAASVLDDSRSTELVVNDLAMRMRIPLDEISDPRAKKIVRDDQRALSRLENLSGAEFDRKFARHMARQQRGELETVQALRGRTVDPQVIALIDGMVPKLERSVQSADSLTAAVAVGDPQR